MRRWHCSLASCALQVTYAKAIIFSIIIYGRMRQFFLCHFLLVQKVTKKDPSNQCTARLLDNALMLLYYYCGELLWDVY